MIFKFISSNNIKLRTLSIQCLLEVGRQFYDFIEDQIDNISPTIKYLMINDEESCSILAYEFWCSIGDIEIARKTSKGYTCRNICNKVYRDLLEVIFKHLSQGNVNSDDSWNLPKAASTLLSILSQCCDYNLINEVIGFIGNNINQNNTLAKEASILAFGSILDTVHKECMAGLVINSIETLMNFLLDKNSPSSLKDATAWTLEKIADLYGDEFAKHGDLFDKLIYSITELLTNSSKRITCHLCKCIHYFSEHFRPIDGQVSSIFSKHVKSLLDIFLKLAFTPKSYDSDNNVAMNCFYVIGSIVENSAPDNKFIISSFFGYLVEAFKSTFIPSNFADNKMRYDYQAYIAASMEPCLITGYLELNFENAKELLSYIITTFKERGCVYEEGLMAASAIAIAIGAEFEPLVKEFGSYVIYALNSISDTSLCKTAIHSISDLIRSIGPHFSPYLEQIIPIILSILSNTEADKILKPHSFNVISDIFITCRDTAFLYFDNIMGLIGSALEAATLIPEDKEDSENIEYFEQLREHIIECLTCIFQTVKDLKKEENFKSFVPCIVNFINRINSNEYNPTTVNII
jgi:importin subunit beta-1